MATKEAESKLGLETVGGETTALLIDEKGITEEVFRRHHNFKPLERKRNLDKMKKKVTCTKSLFLGLIPILSWLPKYDVKNCLMGDIIAGLTVSVLQIPHGLAFAPVGGQAPVVGLYMAVFPVIIYVFFGTSRHLSLGMQVILVMMVGKIVETHAVQEPVFMNGTSVGYSPLEVGIAATFCMGLWELILGVLQLGSLCVLLSHSLVSGLTSGASVHIIFIQLKHIFGIPLTMKTGPLKLIYASIEFVKNLQYTNFLVLGISLVFMLVLYIFNDFIKPILAKKTRIPIPLEFLLIGISIILSQGLNLNVDHDVAIVGEVPSGLPSPVSPPFGLLPAIAMDCLIIALVNISINISLAKVFAKKGNYEVSENQELIAYGLSNMFGGFFQCLPICAALSRSMIQFSVGGKTELSHAFSLLSVLFMLLFLGPFFGNTPMCVLAAIVIVTVKALFMQVKDFPEIWRTSKLDGAVWIVTFVSVILIDIDYGIGIGIAASILILVLQGIQSHVVAVGQVSDPSRIVDVRNYENAKVPPKVLVLKIVGGVNFVNSTKITNKVLKELKKFESQSKGGVHIIIDCGSVLYFDPTGVNQLLALSKTIAENDNKILLANCSPSVYETLKICGYFAQFSKDCVFISVEAAIESINNHITHL